MQMLIGFIAGFFVATFIGLVTTTTPDQAKENLREWARLAVGRK
jgi:hypothetical protein